jgi:hypothetical protein
VNGTSVALSPPAVHGEHVRVRRKLPGELADVVSTAVGEADDGMLRMERGARKAQSETPGVIEVCLDQWLGSVGGHHPVVPGTARERVGIISPTLHEDLEGQGWRVYGRQTLPQVPGRGCRSFGSGLRPREVEQGTRSSGTDSWSAGSGGAVVSGLVVDQPGIVPVSADDREPPTVAASEDAA